MTCEQATALISLLRGRGEEDYRYFHVLCSRVVDPWNLDSSSHGIGHCYYGIESELLPPLIGGDDCETLAAVYWRIIRWRVVFEGDSPQWVLGGPFQHENFWSSGMLKFIQEDMREK